jgi:hypothetical protein
MTESQKQSWSLMVFPMVGFVSALLPVCVNLHFRVGDKVSMGLVPAAFAALNCVCLYFFFGAPSVLRVVVFVVMSPLALLVAAVAALEVYLAWPRWSPEPALAMPAAYFVLGSVGAFILLIAWMWLVRLSQRRQAALLKVICGAVVGGMLAAFGHAAGEIFHKIRLHFPSTQFYGGDSDISALFVWQTGMAFILGVFAWIEWRHGFRSAPFCREQLSNAPPLE